MQYHGENAVVRCQSSERVKPRPASSSRPTPTEYTKQQSPARQPLSSLAYVAANCYNGLATLPEVDPARVGVVGHSFGGKWALFASCFYESAPPQIKVVV